MSTLKLRSNLAPEEREALFTRAFREELGVHYPYAALLPPPGAPVDRLFGHADDRMFSDLFLHKSDVASMAVGLETRSPFLDVALVDFAARLPLDLMVRGVKGKRIPRALVEKRVDPGLAARRKMGLSPPVDEWLRADLAPMIQDTLLAPGALVDAYVERAEVARMFEAHRARRANHRRVLWGLLLLELWLRRERDSSASRAKPPRPADLSASDVRPSHSSDARPSILGENSAPLPHHAG